MELQQSLVIQRQRQVETDDKDRQKVLTINIHLAN